tara:strand:+ start:231 stop:1472 length:1242 start_codon:yes stop_codon:yes gene_type:complete
LRLLAKPKDCCYIFSEKKDTIVTRLSLMVFAFTFAASVVSATTCGGNFQTFLNFMKTEARQKGHSSESIQRFFATAARDFKTIEADRSQGIFQIPFVEFSNRLISKHRIDHAAKNLKKYASIFDRVESRFGVPREILAAFWAFETDFGAVQGQFNTLNSLLTLAHDCRRPELFHPQVFAALKLYETGNFHPSTTQGAWAGEVGMVQMLPEDILFNGIDGDGDGLINLKTSVPDAMMSGANLLKSLGWRANEPWLQEVTLPSALDLSLTGLKTEKTVREWEELGILSRSGEFKSAKLTSSIILPQGQFGPAFITYPNFKVLFEWNQSFVYVTTAAYFATILGGKKRFKNTKPEAGLDDSEMKTLQRKLVSLGFDVGKIDGILGAKTRSAVQSVQQKLGLPADAWPTKKLVLKLN